ARKPSTPASRVAHWQVRPSPVRKDVVGRHPSASVIDVMSASTCRCSPDRGGAYVTTCPARDSPKAARISSTALLMQTRRPMPMLKALLYVDGGASARLHASATSST